MKSDLLKPYETDSSQIEGKAKEIFFPKTIEELKDLVKKTEKITVRAGGSGLAGGSVPLNDSIVDISKLDKIIEFNEPKRTIIVEAGVILDELNEYIDKYNLEFPVNPSSHSICTIGGMIATNAVGSRAIKYGKTSDWINWTEVINSKGILEKKTKFELSDYVGMEGITGIIARAELKLAEKKSRKPSIIKIVSLKELIEKIKELRQDKEITMIEYLDKEVSKMIGLEYEFHLFIEKETKEKGTPQDKELYEIRDRVYPNLSAGGFTRIEDPKLILDKMEHLLSWLYENRVPTYGHISVGIIHPCFSKNKEKLIPEMMKIVKRYGGQISGEHGIGIIKKEFLDKRDRELINSVKKRLDPKNKFNPGKVL